MSLKKNKKTITVMLSLTGLIIALYMFFILKNNYFPEESDNVQEEICNLSAVELTMSSDTFDDQAEITQLITDYLKAKDVNFNAGVSILEFTTPTFYENTKVRLFTTDQAFLPSAFLIKDNEVLAEIGGNDLYIADIDADCIYEVYSEYSVGSGIVSNHIAGYNIATSTYYELGNRGVDDYYLLIDNNKLYAYITAASASSVYENPVVKALVISETDSGEALETKP